MKRKGGGKLTISDFTPDFAKPKKRTDEAALKGFLIAMSQRKQK